LQSNRDRAGDRTLKMRIAVISSSVFPVGGHQGLPGYGGLESIAWWCARGLAAKGHDVTLIAPQGSTCPGVEVFECLPPGGFAEQHHYGGCVYNDANGQPIQWAGYWQKLLELQEKGDFVILDHSWNKMSALLKMEGRLSKTPILGVCHAPVSTMYSSLPPEGIVSFVCISDDQKAHFEALHSPRTARRVYNGIDLDFYRPIETPGSDRYLFLARFSSIKGPDICLKVCNEADVGLDLIGDSTITQEPQYYNYCCSLADGVKRRVVGSVPRGEAVWWYSQARGFLHPIGNRFREPFGLAPVEAQACGCPVLSFNFGALRETVKHGETGFLVKTEKEMLEVIKSSALDSLSRQRCREWASQFSIQNMILGYENLCQRALDGEVW
jgi:glycosyltransferase involved in cell wall biosynthesis